MSVPRFVVALGDVAEGRTRIALLKLGRWIKGTTKFAITKANMAEAVANFRKRQADLVVDYEHASEHPEVAAGGPVPAAGWIKAIDDVPDESGVLWGEVEFTDRARELIAAGEYKYISPSLSYGARDKATGAPQGLTLPSVALTNRPFLEALPALSLSDGWVADETAERGEKKAMRIVLTDRAGLKAKVIQDDNTESVISVEGLEAPPKVIKLSDVGRGSDGRFNFSELPQDGLVAGEVVRAMEAQNELDAAVRAGKITPAQRPHFEKLALSDLPAFREIVKTLGQQVDLSERGLGGGEGLSGADAVDRKIDTKVRERMATDKALDYGQALRLVLSENKDLREAKNLAMRD